MNYNDRISMNYIYRTKKTTRKDRALKHDFYNVKKYNQDLPEHYKTIKLKIHTLTLSTLEIISEINNVSISEIISYMLLRSPKYRSLDLTYKQVYPYYKRDLT